MKPISWNAADTYLVGSASWQGHVECFGGGTELHVNACASLSENL